MNWDIIFSGFNTTLIILVVTIIFFVRGKIRSDLVALCSLLALLLFGILTTGEALAGFSSSIVLMMAGLFVIGGAISRTGLAKLIGSKILKLAGGNENLLFVLVMLVTAFIGAFVSNTGTVAIMMPILISIAASSKLNIRRYLMPMAFASAMGIFTLISTPPNMIIQDTLVNNGFEPLGFFSFAPIGCIAVIVGIIILFFSSRLLKANKNGNDRSVQSKSLSELIEEYDLNNNLWKIIVPGKTEIIGKSLDELQLTSNYGIVVGKIIHKGKSGFILKKDEQEIARPDSRIAKDDILYCYGSIDNIKLFVEHSSLILSDISQKEKESGSEEYGLIEAVILPDSYLENRTVTDSRFREKYHVIVASIKSSVSGPAKDVKDKKMQTGDVLLLSGKWEDIISLSNNQRDFVIIGQPEKEASKVSFNKKAPLAASILIAMVFAMTFNLLPAVTVVLIAAVLMVITGCLRNMEEAYDSINWNSIVLIAAMLPMATAFEKTGITTYISEALSQGFGSMGPSVMLAAIYCFTSILSLFISNTATAVLFAPIAMKTALVMNVSPYPFLLAVAVAASMCFASPFSTPPNALVMNAGNYTFKDYVKVGLPLQIIMGVVMIIFIPLIFPF
ncbi:SLC13 family permease [Prevotella sp. 10(H)]|uniref:SLC13 family permease n=1 Tax=Prevotella sp. 10(H) TaxID=1158294 RepID=UPI0004A73C3B|nr:SLC13 family permease [Prevotella sp. 10(H)]